MLLPGRLLAARLERDVGPGRQRHRQAGLSRVPPHRRHPPPQAPRRSALPAPPWRCVVVSIRCRHGGRGYRGPRGHRRAPRPAGSCDARPRCHAAIRDVCALCQVEFGACISASLAYKRVLARIGEGRVLLLDRAPQRSRAGAAVPLRAAALLPREPRIRAFAAPGIASPRSRANEVVSRRFRAHGAIVNPSGSACFVSSC